MRFEEFEPHYLEILDYFGFDREGDEEAARLLSELLDRDDLSLLRDRISGNVVTVCGNAEILREQLNDIEGVVIAADAAALVLYDAGILPDVIFTDLDGADDPFITMSDEGALIVVHAHGDNKPLLSRWVSRLKGPLVGTTQSRPFDGIHNFGGFTDGDRAVFAADALGAEKIIILGFDLSDTSVDPMKRGKLLWARKLLGMIGYDL
ncbi:hypothetical protein RJ53_03270 [Methanocalculus chunghsingensis]|uniref:6-hydroxymethyl-7,8-dihydropterin pyrophosphokinase n=1 Tax=Methanocalculus chunghsingensis TaxID=156457 RepID=A0A8J7W6R4_9EURY|nr:6-hydroxymethylpterin diphosphokinase MptE-like protein [Methanocalculus chunghsingensis]MBR1368573.1 hypothetical protein [Methanocalculus chunghsingensis]